MREYIPAGGVSVTLTDVYRYLQSVFTIKINSPSCFLLSALCEGTSITKYPMLQVVTREFSQTVWKVNYGYKHLILKFIRLLMSITQRA